MYQFIVLGLLASLVIGGGFYITKSDQSGILAEAFSAKPGAPSFETLAGGYPCLSGCISPATLLLVRDGTAALHTYFDDDRGTVIERGIWRFAAEDAIQISLRSDATGNFEKPHTITATIADDALSQSVYDHTLFPNLSEPIFTKGGE